MDKQRPTDFYLGWMLDKHCQIGMYEYVNKPNVFRHVFATPALTGSLQLLPAGGEEWRTDSAHVAAVTTS